MGGRGSKKSKTGKKPFLQRKGSAKERHRQGHFASDKHDVASDGTVGRKMAAPGGITFNASTLNDRDVGDEDLTLVDISTCSPSEDTLCSNDNEERHGLDIFLTASERAKRPRLVEATSFCLPQRNLADIYADNPDLKLSNIDNGTMELAGNTVKQIVFEATHEFLQRNIPENERQKVWDRILRGSRDAGHEVEDDKTTTSVTIASDKLHLHASRPLSHLISNCTSILTGNFSTTDPKAVRVVFDKGISLCDALEDKRRLDKLGKAVQAIRWLMLGLECKTADLYRRLNQELDKIDRDFPVRWIGHGEEKELLVSEERQQAERAILQACKRSYDDNKEPFRVAFVQALQGLMAPMD